MNLKKENVAAVEEYGYSVFLLSLICATLYTVATGAVIRPSSFLALNFVVAGGVAAARIALNRDLDYSNEFVVGVTGATFNVVGGIAATMYLRHKGRLRE